LKGIHMYKHIPPRMHVYVHTLEHAYSYDRGRDTRQEDVEGLPRQSRISPSMLSIPRIIKRTHVTGTEHGGLRTGSKAQAEDAEGGGGVNRARAGFEE